MVEALGKKIALVLCVLACLIMNAHAFLPRWWQTPAPAVAPAAPTLTETQLMECPSEVISKLRDLSFEQLKSVCPTRSDIPHDINTCTECSCSVYQLIKEAVASSHEEMQKLASACGPIFSLDTTFDGLNTKAVVDFLHLCKDVPEQVDFKTCAPLSVNAMSGPSDNLNADDMLSFLTTNLTGITGSEVIQLLDIADGLDLANDEAGLVSDVGMTISFVEDLAQLINMAEGQLPQQSMNDSSVLCPGFTTPGSCESFEELRRICPWSCERQKEECAYASLEACQLSAFKEACPVTCKQIEVISSDLQTLSLEGAIQISTLTDGSAIKTNNLKGTVEEECMCFNVFQPVCNKRTGEMYANLCEAQCEGDQLEVGPCREETLENVVAFAAQASATEDDLTYIAERSGSLECSQDCPEVYDPVCSTTKVYQNNCHAKCDFVYDAKPCAQHTGRLETELVSSTSVESDANSAATSIALTSSLFLLSVLVIPML